MLAATYLHDDLGVGEDAGTGEAVVDGMEQKLRAGDVNTIAAGCKHTIMATTQLDFIKVQIGESISVANKKEHELNQ